MEKAGAAGGSNNGPSDLHKLEPIPSSSMGGSGSTTLDPKDRVNKGKRAGDYTPIPVPPPPPRNVAMRYIGVNREQQVREGGTNKQPGCMLFALQLHAGHLCMYACTH
eukprot:262824-Pelagomonas_calceolata.AAC.1